MDYVKAQEDLLAAMESWRDVSMAPDDPNQPQTFQQAQQQYNRIQNHLKNQQQAPPMIPQADIYSARAEAEAARRAAAEPGLWTDTKNYLSDTLASSPLKQFPLLGLPSRWMDVADKAQAGDTIAANLRAYFGDDDVEDALTGMVRGREGAQQDFDTMLPAYQENLANVEALTDPGITNIQRAMAQPGMMPGLRQFVSDPVAGTSLLAQTLGRSPASAVLGAGGSTIGGLTGGPLGATGGGALGGAAGGWIDERTGGIVRMLQERGLDIENPEHIQLLQENPEVFDLASEQAQKRAAAIAAFSAIAGGVAGGLGRIAGAPLHALGRLAMPARAGAAIGAVPAAGVLEGAGEYAAQRAAGQDINWPDVKLEALMGGVMDAGTAIGGVASGQLAPRAPQLNERTRALAAKEARLIAEGLPFGGMVNIVMGDVEATGSAEMIPDVEGQGEQVNINIDNLIRRSDGTRSGIRAQLMEDLAHELGGHQWVQQMITENPNFVAEAFKANEDLILAWQKKSQYQDFGDTSDNILYEEWAAHFAEMDTKVLRRIELAIVNHLQKLIGKDATAKLIKSWDARNITMRNIAKEHLRQLKEKGAAGEAQPVQTITAEQSEALARPDEDMDVTLRTVVEEGLDMSDPELQRATRQRESRGNIQDPSRRKFMKQTAGAVAGAAVDPSILLEPATPTPPEAPAGFGGGIMRPGVAPEMEGTLRAAAADAAPTGGLVTPQVEDAFDDFDFDVAAQEDAEIQARLDEVEAQDDKKRVPQKWQELDTPELQALMESNRAKDNPIWVAQNKELENRKAAEQEADADAELYVDTVDEIMSVYDEDATAAEAAADGTLNDRIISYAAETPFTREELWDGVNQRIEEAAEDTVQPVRRFSRARKPKSETVQRDINEEKGKANKRIIASDAEEAEKEARVKLLKRLQNVMGAKARKRGIDAGDQDVFQEQAATIVEGDIEAVEAFIKPFEEQLTGGSETAYIADRRRALRAERIGKTDSEILKYRPKGAKHPMEGKMTYPFALEEIDRQEKAGEITAEEAEIRRLAVNNVRR